MTIDTFYFWAWLFIILGLFANRYTRNLLDRDYSEILTVTSGYLLALVGVKNTSQKIVMFNWTWEQLSPFIVIISCTMILVSLILRAFRNKKLKSSEALQENFIKLKDEYYKLCSDNLRVIFKQFVGQPKTRVSIYKFEDNHFKLIGRYSKTPNFNTKGREKYNSTEGFIATGWDNGEHAEYGLPLYEQGSAEYIKQITAKCNIPKRTIKRMNMKSSSFYVKTVENEEGDSRVHLGIIVFEKISADAIDKTVINQLIDSNVELLRTIFKSMKTLHNID